MSRKHEAETDGAARSWKGRMSRWGAQAGDALRHPTRRWWIVGGALLATGAFGAGTVMAAWNQACGGACPSAEDIELFAPQQATEVYDAEGNLLALFYRERRQLVALESLPRHVPLAFVAIEDRRFFDHDGVDVVRIVGSIRDNVVEGFGASGASTISMQLARNLFPQQLPPGEKSLRRKIAEAKLALEMERRFTKRRILELYLNHIYLGAGAYGIEAAARTYFGKPAAELTVVEAATLAGLPKAPSQLNPQRNPDGAHARRDLVLRAMRETGVIGDVEEASARAEPLALAPPRGLRSAPYFVEHVRRDLEEQLGELLYTGGLKIYTSLDPELQRESEEALEEHLRQIEAGRHGRFGHPTYARFSETLEAGQIPSHTPYLQGMVSVMDPHTGEVKALVGGRDFRHSQFNRATQALRQPGSAFKPFVFAAALERGRSPLYSVSDAPYALAMSDGSVWSPRNYSGEYGGMTTLREAMKRSKNMVAIRLGQEVGAPAVADLARRTGLTSPVPSYPSVFIGSAGVYPIELVGAYAAFANGGMKVEPRFVTRIVDRDGNLLWQPGSRPQPAIAPSTAWLMTDILRGVVDGGTGYNARNPAIGNLPYTIPAAGKTGTTNDATDVWFVGYTPDLVAGVWIGMDQPRRIMVGATGGGLAVPIWARVMRKHYADLEPPPAWPRPSDVVERQISRWTGKAVTPDCIYGFSSYTDFFVAGSAPTPGCEPPDVWSDPTPELLGRPVIPGQARVPAPEDHADRPRRGRP
jgi:penicillin-binding protein 1A